MNSPIRVQIGIQESQVSEEAIRKLAAMTSTDSLTDFRADKLKNEDERGLKSKSIRRMLTDVLNDAANGRSGGYHLSDQTEQFFSSARSRVRTEDGEPVEKKPQADAIRDLFNVSSGDPIVLSEIELVNKAVEVARQQGRSATFTADDLIREGIGMAAQSIISKHVAATNATKGDVPDNLPGSGDAHYLAILNELRALVNDPDKWFSSDPKVNRFGRRRGNKITVSILSRAAGTNDVQIRSFLKRHGITDVVDPKNRKDEE